jgi:hypothetical protein
MVRLGLKKRKSMENSMMECLFFDEDFKNRYFYSQGLKSGKRDESYRFRLGLKMRKPMKDLMLECPYCEEVFKNR